MTEKVIANIVDKDGDKLTVKKWSDDDISISIKTHARSISETVVITKEQCATLSDVLKILSQE